MHLFIMNRTISFLFMSLFSVDFFRSFGGALAVLQGAFLVSRYSVLDARGVFPVPRSSFLDSCDLDLRRLFEHDECLDDDRDLALFLRWLIDVCSFSCFLCFEFLDLLAGEVFELVLD